LTKDIEERKKLTFEQAEGIEPLPSQLQLREVSPKLRAVLWNRIHSYLDDATEHSAYGTSYIEKPWSTILKEEHVYRQHGMVDDFGNVAKDLIADPMFSYIALMKALAMASADSDSRTAKETGQSVPESPSIGITRRVGDISGRSFWRCRSDVCFRG
jgi:hypothetical protein